MNLTELDVAELAAMHAAINTVVDRFEPELVDDHGIYNVLHQITTELARRDIEAADTKQKLVQVERIVDDFILNPVACAELCSRLFDVLYPGVETTPRNKTVKSGPTQVIIGRGES